MGIVYVSGFDTAGIPAKCGMALRAPQLTASGNAENAHAARGARLGVLPHQGRRRHIVGIAFVWRIAIVALDLAAFWTRPFLAQTAFPLTAEKSATFGVRTRTGKCCTGGGSGGHTNMVPLIV